MKAEEIEQIVTFVSSQIALCNRQLTSHPNLDLYATIKKVCDSATKTTTNLGFDSRTEQQHARLIEEIGSNTFTVKP